VFRTGSDPPLVRPSHLEAQISPDDTGSFWVWQPRFSTRPDLVDRKFPGWRHRVTDAEKAAGKWNQYEIICKGDRVTLLLNGEVVNQGAGALTAASRVALLAQGTTIEFRSIRLRPAPVTEKPDKEEKKGDVGVGLIRVFDPIKKFVHGVAFSGDGRRVFSGGTDRMACLWDVETGKELRSFYQGGDVLSVAFSPHGKTAASGGAGGQIALWDTETGEECGKRLLGHARGVWSLAFSPDGNRIVSGGDDGTVRVWDVASGRQLYNLRGHKGAVLSVAFSPDGSRVASGGNDRTVRLWDAHTGRQFKALTGHTVLCANVSDIGLLKGSQERAIREDGTSSGRSR
jgi:WD40 repeat protein